MGRGSSLSTTTAAPVAARPGAAHARLALQPAVFSSYEQFAREKLAIELIEDDRAAHEAAQRLCRLSPSRLAVDFETAANSGFGVFNGSLRLIQLAVDEPQRGIAPRQVIIDCFRADPRPFLELLEDDRVDKLIHHMLFEQRWAAIRLGVTINPVLDTRYAWQFLQRRLRNGGEWALPGYEEHDNKLATLVERYLGFALPKAEQSGDWGRRSLTPQQIMYAAMDVAVMGPLADRTLEVARKLGVEDDLRKRCVASALKTAHNAREKARESTDDFNRVAAAWRRARTREELDSLRRAARQMALTAGSWVKLDRLYEQLAAGLDG
jgi:ribonuclease D